MKLLGALVGECAQWSVYTAKDVSQQLQDTKYKPEYSSAKPFWSSQKFVQARQGALRVLCRWLTVSETGCGTLFSGTRRLQTQTLAVICRIYPLNVQSNLFHLVCLHVSVDSMIAGSRITSCMPQMSYSDLRTPHLSLTYITSQPCLFHSHTYMWWTVRAYTDWSKFDFDSEHWDGESEEPNVWMYKEISPHPHLPRCKLHHPQLHTLLLSRW